MSGILLGNTACKGASAALGKQCKLRPGLPMSAAIPLDHSLPSQVGVTWQYTTASAALTHPCSQRCQAVHSIAAGLHNWPAGIITPWPEDAQAHPSQLCFLAAAFQPGDSRRWGSAVTTCHHQALCLVALLCIVSCPEHPRSLMPRQSEQAAVEHIPMLKASCSAFKHAQPASMSCHQAVQLHCCIESQAHIAFYIQAPAPCYNFLASCPPSTPKICKIVGCTAPAFAMTAYTIAASATEAARGPQAAMEKAVGGQ